jgi:hypothetical protein
VNVTPLQSPLAGEQLVAVDPPLNPRLDAGWRRRLHLFTGRSLDAAALTAEQRSRAARAALLARALTPGIVAGLEVSLHGADLGSAVLDVAPGLGITAWGEDVRLARSLQVRLDRIQVVEEEGGGAGSTLGELIVQGRSLPALILVLQPVLVEEIGASDGLDPCERDLQSEAFEDQRMVDACRPLLIAWPSDELPLPANTGPSWRNRLAWAVFEEARRRSGDLLPWEAVGLPLVLVGSDAARHVLFLDRSSVARIGGRPRQRTALLPGAGDPALWQARIQQFGEHLGDLFSVPGATIASLAGRFERLPPAGLLPREAATFTPSLQGAADQDGGDQSFFPNRFLVGAVPVPLDELEPLFEASAPLAPLTLAHDEEVQLLVPVPGALYEPDLLIQDRVDPVFATTLAEFRADRNGWLGRREDVREKLNTLLKALQGGGAVLPYPAVDPDAQSGEVPLPVGEPKEDDFGTFPEPTDTKIHVLRKLRRQFGADPSKRQFRDGPFILLKNEWNRDLLAGEGLEGLIRVLAGKIAKANDKIDLGFLHLQTEIYRVRQIVLGNVEGTRLATSPVLAEIAKGESAVVTRENLAKFFAADKLGADSFTGLPAGGGTPESAESAEAAEAAPLAPAAPARFVAGPALAGLNLNAVKAASVGTLRAVPSLKVKEAAGSSGAVREQNPIPGATIDFRNLSIVERLRVNPAHQALDFALAVMLQVFNGLDDLGLMVDDLEVPLYVVKTVNGVAVKTREDQPYKLARNGLAATILKQPRSAAAEQANILGDAVAFLETASVFLRRLEGRVQLYQDALDSCRQVWEEVRGLLSAAHQRLAGIERELAEARHDVAVTLALLAEEEKRVAGINSRRQEILTRHVPFLAWHRPRTVDALADAPVRSLDPPPAEDPVPAALARPADPPAELREMVELLRDAPLSWFRYLPQLLDKLDRLDVLLAVLRLAKRRAEVAVSRPLLQVATLALTSPAAQGASQTLVAQRQLLGQARTEVARLDLAVVERLSWKGAADLARSVLSLGDLLDIPHGRAEVVRSGARELDQILRVATALWAGFGEVLPVLRLDWVERLSQFDEPFDLRRLSGLPRWEEIEIEDRRTLQALVDWLVQRIEPKAPQAVAMMNDLVRVCVLLASHAPVDRIVAGRVEKDTPIRLGGIVPVVVDLTRVRIGMPVLFFSQETVAVRAIVEDLGGGGAYARVVEASVERLSVNARAEFTEAPGFTAVTTPGKAG